MREGESNFPDALDPSLVGTYPPEAYAGGGFVWDAVLEYRVWCHSDPGTGDDSFYVFETYQEALGFHESNPGTEEPLALVLQEEYLDEPEAGRYIHVRERRITEWPVVFLRRPRRTSNTVPNFLSPTAPPNRLDILRGLAPPT